MKTCFKQWHTCTDVRQQNDRYNNFLMSGRNFNNRVSNKISIVVADDYSADTEASSQSETYGGSTKRKQIKSMLPLMPQLITATVIYTDEEKEEKGKKCIVDREGS